MAILFIYQYGNAIIVLKLNLFFRKEFLCKPLAEELRTLEKKEHQAKRLGTA